MNTKKVVLDQIANSIQLAGYDPYEQLYGYLRTKNSFYITRQGNAREIIKEVDETELESYLITLKNKQL